MNLRLLERGTKLKVFEEYGGCATSNEFEATFKYFDTERLFTVYSPKLYDYYDKLNPDANLCISLMTGANIHRFTGRVVEKQRTVGMILIEQLTEIITINRRVYDRDELRVRVSIYGLSEAKRSADHFSKPDAEADMVDMTYDVSVGGICVISNILLSSKYDPYYLAEFSLGLGEKDSFLLPVKLVRRSNYPRTKIGRYDYGFQFIFDNHPDEKGRLSRAILSRKLLFR